jgi:hypothetical protein
MNANKKNGFLSLIAAFFRNIFRKKNPIKSKQNSNQADDIYPLF